MKKLLFVLVVLVALSTSAYATTSFLPHVGGGSAPAGADIRVDTTVTPSGANWQWNYLVTPQNGATEVQSFTVYIGSIGIANLVGAPAADVPTLGVWNSEGWTTTVDTVNNAVQWTSGVAPKLTPANPGTFWLVSKLPLSGMMVDATAQNGGVYSGQVPGPAVPEPISILLGTLGLAAVGGLRRLRGK